MFFQGTIQLPIEGNADRNVIAIHDRDKIVQGLVTAAKLVAKMGVDVDDRKPGVLFGVRGHLEFAGGAKIPQQQLASLAAIQRRIDLR